jgi:pyruvate formate lyase activating enzyme
MTEAPIESIPLYHFFPGSPWAVVDGPSDAAIEPSASCKGVFWRAMPPQEAIEAARKRALSAACAITDAFTAATVEALAPGLDACLIELPAPSEVVAAIGLLKRKENIHVECLLPVPAALDAEALLEVSQQVIDGPGRGAPVHLIGAADDVPTATLEAAQKLLRKAGVLYAYIRGVPGHAAQSTYCHDCRAMLIERDDDRMVSNRILMGKCPFCYVDIPGRWVADPRMPG